MEHDVIGYEDRLWRTCLIHKSSARCMFGGFNCIGRCQMALGEEFLSNLDEVEEDITKIVYC